MREALTALCLEGLSPTRHGTWSHRSTASPAVSWERGPYGQRWCRRTQRSCRRTQKEPVMGLGKKAKREAKAVKGKTKKDAGKVKHKGKKAKNAAKH
jgi:hypothetical protein